MYFYGLWRNLPVCLELREEELVGCRTPDKGDINTLTPEQRERETTEKLHFVRKRQPSTPTVNLSVVWKLFEGGFVRFVGREGL